jgi:DNA invertase Pin-like site-specific DNA recombinase
LKAAKAHGVQFGRKPSLTPAQAKHARKLIEGGGNPRTVARSFGVDRSTMSRNLRKLAHTA